MGDKIRKMLETKKMKRIFWSVFLKRWNIFHGIQLWKLHQYTKYCQQTYFHNGLQYYENWKVAEQYTRLIYDFVLKVIDAVRHHHTSMKWCGNTRVHVIRLFRSYCKLNMHVRCLLNSACKAYQDRVILPNNINRTGIIVDCPHVPAEIDPEHPGHINPQVFLADL